MENRQFSPSLRTGSPRPSMHRQRSNSFPLVEALGCSTPEAQLILAEGKAAVHRRRRAHGRRNRSVHDENITTFDPRDHMKYLDGLAALASPQDRPVPSEAKSCHARIPSDATDRSSSTVIPESHDGETDPNASSTNSLGDYSANLAQFIKSQLKSIPTYRPSHTPTPLSPRSCPDLTFSTRSPPQSPKRPVKRPTEAPKTIDIPPVRPPMKSAFSEWSTTEDDTDDEAPAVPDLEMYGKRVMSKGSSDTPSVLGYYEASHSSYLFPSTPSDEKPEPDTAKGFTFPNPSARPGSSTQPQDDDDYPSSCASHPQLTSSSAPSNTSSASTSSYFDCGRPIALTSHMKNRIIAAVTPPYPQSKMITAISPWEGGALANVHDVFVESQQRVHVDGMSFDMIRDFNVPSRVTTPC